MKNLLTALLFGPKVRAILTGTLLCTGTAMATSLPEGLQVRHTASGMRIDYRPQPVPCDTMVTAAGAFLRPLLPALRVHSNADGSHIQYVLSAMVQIDAPMRFDSTRTNVSWNTAHLPLYRYVADRPALRETPAIPLQSAIDVRYRGIAGTRHLAEVRIVVAERLNGVTTTVKNISATVSGANLTALASSPDMNVGLRKAAPSDRVQGADERFDLVARLRLEREGVYVLTAENLRSAGFPTDAAAAQSLKIFGRGGMELPESVDSALTGLVEQAITVRTAANGSIDRVLFYGCGITGWVLNKRVIHSMNHYSASSSYLLTVGGSPGKRASVRPSSQNAVAVQHQTVRARVFFEDEISSPYNSGSGRRWYGRSVENKGSMNLTTVLPGFVPNGTVRYRFSLAHRSDSLGTWVITDNGMAVLQRNLPAKSDYMDAYNDTMSASIDAAKLQADGRSSLKLTYSSNDKIATGVLDWYEIEYSRAVAASNGSFDFWLDTTTSGAQQVEVNGFSGEIMGYDVTDRARPVLVENAAVTGGMFALREDLASSVRRYYISSEILTPGIEKVSYPNLRTSPRNADVIVITHNDLAGSAAKFAAYRQEQGELTTTVVTTADIYTEFGYGMQDPTAIRDFIAHAMNTWTTSPRYVVLWGDGHFDYKNISTLVPNYVIPYESFDAYGLSSGLATYTTDDYYVLVVGNDPQVDLAIGRVPVTSEEAGMAFVEKLRRYEHEASQDDWRTRVTLIADDGATDPDHSDQSTHLDQSEDLWKLRIPSAVQSKKIYMVEYPTDNIAKGRRKPEVTNDMISTINTTGCLLLNWIGHGNPRVWAHENIFTRETTPGLMTNGTKPFFLTAATCDFARFDMPEVQSGAEEMLMMKSGGAIGVFSATRVVLSSQNAAINEAFYADLFKRDATGRLPRVGDVLMEVKQVKTDVNDQKFFLLSDPTLRLHIPNRDIVFDTVADVPLTGDTTIGLTALQTVRVTGYVTGMAASGSDPAFEGTCTVSLYDASQPVSVTDNDIYKSVNRFVRPGAALSRGTYPVKNGRFEATFVIPKDIAFSAERAGLFGYAVSTDEHFAMGMTNRVVVDGVTSVIFPDDEGPEIALYMDSRKFIGGGLVRSNPILLVDLSDETGINTTGNGIGHNLEALFDGTRIENLTSSFTTSLTNSRAGTASKQIFDMAAGRHTVRVRAWDVLNNVSESSTTFRIADSSAGIVTDGVFNYPNPFSSSTTIRFTHNVARPFTAVARIFDLSGRMVFERPMEISDMQTAEVSWDGHDMEGNHAGSGIFQAVVRIVTENGETHDVGNKLNLIR